jgi:hypothetical protein
MLAHSPPVPLIIDYRNEGREVTAQDEEGILLALRRRRRVRRIRLCIPSSSLRRLVAAIDGEFPILENLYITPLTDDGNGLSLPETFKAPRLRHYALNDVTYSPDTFRPPPPMPHIPSTERIGQVTLYNGPQLWRYARFSCYVYQPWE